MSDKPKKPFFKRTWVTVLICVIVGILVFCAAITITIKVRRDNIAASATQRPTAEPTAEPSATPVPERSYDLGATLDFDPDTTLMGLDQSVLDTYAGTEGLGGAYWADVTTDEVRALGALIIRHIELDLSYLYYEGAYYRLGWGLGGYGLVDVAVCDLNYDGVPELIYSYSYGNQSEYTARIAWFDFAAMESVDAPFWVMEDNLAVSIENGSCYVYHAKRQTGNSEGGYVIYLHERIGELIEENGALYLILD